MPALSLLAERFPRLLLVGLCLLMALPGFFSLPSGDRDESRFAQATRQMLDSGDYVRLRVGEEDRNKKPVGIHWAQAASVHAVEALGLGSRRDIWAYRIPSLLGMVLAVLLTHALGRRLVGARPALLAAAMLGGCLVLMVEAHIAKTDAALLASVTAAMGLMGAAYLNPSGFAARQALGFWVALGIGILLKGPIAPMVPLLAGLTLFAADRWRAPWLRALRPAWGVPLMVAIVLPWMVAIGIATEGRFFAQALGDDMLGKVGSGDEKHWGPPGFYLLTFPIAAFPAGVLAILAARGAWAERALPRTRFLLAWIVPTWLVFEAVATKLPHYTLPTYPAVMLLAAAWAMDPLRRAPPRWLVRVAQGLVAAVALGIAAVALFVPWFVTGHEPVGALLSVPFAVGLLVLVVRALGRGQWPRAAVLGVAAAVPLYASVMEFTLPRVAPIWIAPRLEAALDAHAPGWAPERFGITSHAEPSTLFRLGAAVRFLRRGEDAARFLHDSPPGAPGRTVAVGHRALDDFRREAASLGMAPREVARLDGFNYTRGRALTLHLFQKD